MKTLAPSLRRQIPTTAAALVVAIACPCPVTGDPVSAYWMAHHGLSENDLLFDFDNDGYLTRAEFFLGTDPFDPQSALDPQFVVDDDGLTLLEWDTIEGVAYQLEETSDLKTWGAMGGALLGTGETFELEIGGDQTRGLYRFAPALQDSDGDCLSDFEEIHYSRTDPNDPDSDGDGIDDGDEVKIYQTDPNYASPTGRGTLRGRVVHDDDGDPFTRIHAGIESWTVFLDKNLNGELDSGEPNLQTANDGTFAFEQLDAGYYRVCTILPTAWSQVFPEIDAPYSADGFPDAVVEMLDSGNGTLPMPYGINKQSEVERRLLLGLIQEAVDPGIVLGQLPETPYTPPLGLWSDVDFMGIPDGASVTLEFSNEEIIDGPGIDLVVASLDQPAGEKGLIYLGRTLADMQLVGQFDEGGDLGIDLDAVGISPPIHFVRIEGQDNLGAVDGFDLVGMKAIHFQPPPRGHYDVVVSADEEVTGIDFGVQGVDRAPHVLVYTPQSQVLEGESLTIQVISSDDLGIVTQSLEINGSPVTLDALGEATHTASYAGILHVEAKAVDTAGQEATSLMQVLVHHADGTPPDLSGLGIDSASGENAPAISVASPYVGQILEGDTPIIGSILPTGSEVTQWCVEYASTTVVDPEDLEHEDPDYILLGQGAGTVVDQTLATLPADTLNPDTYLIRIKATGGHTAYFGFVVAVGLEELDIRPDIEITSPQSSSAVTYLTDIVGGISTRQTLREWSMEVAPLSEVNLENLGDDTPNYKPIAQGTSPISGGVLGTFDPTLLPNDAYFVRVTAWNTNGLGWTDGVILNVTGKAKLGNFAMEFTDVSLPCAGIPIEIKRVYDSLNAETSGAFGYGWRLSAHDPNITETVPQTGTAFLATPFQIGTRVYLTTPSGDRVGFTFDVEAGPSGFLGTAYAAKFIPDPGIRESLEVPEGDTAFLSVAPTGEVSLFFINAPYNPSEYILTDEDGLRYTYDQGHGLVEIEDLNGNKVLFTDDGIEHTGGTRIDFTRDAEGRITSITGPSCGEWHYHYDLLGDLTEVRYPDAQSASFVYASDPAHFLTSHQNAVGVPSQTMEYDVDGRIAAIIDAEGNRTEQNWDPRASIGTFTDALGNATTYEYDDLGNIVRQINPPGGGEIHYEYGDPNNPFLETAITDPNGSRTTFEYDAQGKLVERVEPIGGVTRWEYDDVGNVTKIIPAQGLPVEIEYDAASNPLLYRLGSSLREHRMTYTATGLLATYEDPEGGLLRYEYEGAWSQPQKTTFPDGSVQLVEFDADGMPIKVTDPTGAETQFTYDAQHRVVEMRDSLGNTRTTTYLRDALPSSRTDRLGRSTTYAYSDNDNLEEVQLHDGTRTRYEYDALGNLTAIIDALDYRTEFSYDANRRLVEERDPNGKTRSYEYDLVGNITAIVDRNSRKRSFVYDARNRIAEEHWHESSDDSIVRTLSFEYDTLDRLKEAADPDTTINFAWSGNPGSKVQSERVVHANRAPVQVTLGYDNNDELTRLGYIGSLKAVRYVRDASGRASVVKLDLGTSDSVRWEQDFDGRGRAHTVRRFSDLVGTNEVGSTTRDLDPRGWASAITHFDKSGIVHNPSSFDFTRNAEGQITQHQHDGDLLDFVYDSIGQLTNVASSTASGPQESYLYDANGNRLSSHRHGSTSVDVGNRLSAAGDWALDYDGEGNLTRKTHGVTGEIWDYHYDHRNRLTKVTQQLSASDPTVSLAEYLYDPLDRRSAVIKADQTLWTYYAEEHMFLDFLNDETDPYRMAAHGDEIDSLMGMWHRTHGSLFALTDHLHTVHQWLDRDGNSVGTFEYDSFGNILNSTGIASSLLQPAAFTGRLWDSDAELYYYRARYYDPPLGRFISEDPIGFAGDPSNLYRYADNNPVITRDPTGNLSLVETAITAVVFAVDTVRGWLTAFLDEFLPAAFEVLKEFIESLLERVKEVVTFLAESLRKQIDQEIEDLTTLNGLLSS